MFDGILYFFRDTLSGTHYFIYVFICTILLLSIVGYLFKEKYAKIEFSLTSKPAPAKAETSAAVDKKALKKAKKEQKKQGKNKKVVVMQGAQPTQAQTPVTAPAPSGQTQTNPALQQPANNLAATALQKPIAAPTTPVMQPTQQNVQQPASPNVTQTPVNAAQTDQGIPEIIN